jgi:hypothetical protein
MMLLALIAGSCGSSPRQGDDPLKNVLNPNQSVNTRVAAVGEAFDRAVVKSDRVALRSELWPLVWSPETPGPLKKEIVTRLLAETDEEVSQGVREELRLNLPHQTSREVVALVSDAAAERGWTEYVPALVRAWARGAEGETDATRPERRAIERLAPGKPIEEVVFGVFTDPPPDTPGTRRMKLEETYRLSAWDLLARLDRDGQRRLAMLQALTSRGETRPYVDEALAAHRELLVLPFSSEELRWVSRLRDRRNGANAAWWAEASAAVMSLTPEQRTGLQLRHAEFVRFARAHRSAWMTMSRAELASEASRRFGGREVRTASAGRSSGRDPITERYTQAEPRMTWGDLLAVLVVDDALQDAGTMKSLSTYADYDRRDTTTEYGGIIETTPSGGFMATLYQPRPGQRLGDDRFIASEDMINASDRAIAHFHFHVMQRFNGRAAGPSLEDLDYSNRFGRACVVLTSIDTKTLSADYFQPGMIVVDLGDFVPARD